MLNDFGDKLKEQLALIQRHLADSIDKIKYLDSKCNEKIDKH